MLILPSPLTSALEARAWVPPLERCFSCSIVHHCYGRSETKSTNYRKRIWEQSSLRLKCLGQAMRFYGRARHNQASSLSEQAQFPQEAMSVSSLKVSRFTSVIRGERVQVKTRLRARRAGLRLSSEFPIKPSKVLFASGHYGHGGDFGRFVRVYFLDGFSQAPCTGPFHS